MSDLMSPFEKFRESSPAALHGAANRGRFRDELVALLRERTEPLKPNPGQPIDTNGRYAALMAFIEHLQGVFEYDARLGVLQQALRLADNAIGGEMLSIIGRIREGTDPAVALNDLVCAAYDDATRGVPELRERVQRAQERAEHAERELTGHTIVVAALEAERDEHRARANALQHQLDQGRRGLRFAEEPPPDPEPEPEGLPANIREHGSGFQAYKRFDGKQWHGEIHPSVAEAVAELTEKVSEMGRQAASERLRQERGVAA